MLQQSIAGILVVVAAAYALWYWMPAGLRRRLGRMQKGLGEKPGCGACSSCVGCATVGQAGGVDATDREARQPIWIKPKP